MTCAQYYIFIFNMIFLISCGQTEIISDDSSLNNIVGQAYDGYLIDGNLEDEIEILDSASKLQITFSDKNPLSAQIYFEGSIRIFYMMSWWDITDDIQKNIDNLYVENEKLSGIVIIRDVELGFTGQFNIDKSELTITLEKIGMLTLHKIQSENTAGDKT